MHYNTLFNLLTLPLSSSANLNRAPSSTDGSLRLGTNAS
jgi:hypothetical protein